MLFCRVAPVLVASVRTTSVLVASVRITSVLVASVLVALAAGACRRSAAADWDWAAATPRVVDADELVALLKPTGDEQLVLANFWASWCGPCLSEMPALVELRRSCAERGVRVLAVSLDLAEPQQVRTVEQLAAFMQHRDFALPALAYRGDPESLEARLHLPSGPPCTLVFDRRGVEVARLDGAGTRAEFETLITRALAP